MCATPSSTPLPGYSLYNAPRQRTDLHRVQCSARQREGQAWCCGKLLFFFLPCIMHYLCQKKRSISRYLPQTKRDACAAGMWSAVGIRRVALLPAALALVVAAGQPAQFNRVRCTPDRRWHTLQSSLPAPLHRPVPSRPIRHCR